MNKKNRRTLLIAAGVAGLVCAAAWAAVVRPQRAELETASFRLAAVHAELAAHRSSGIDPLLLREQLATIDQRTQRINESFYHDDVRADLYSTFTETARACDIKLERINPSEQSGRGDSQIVVVEHTIGFQAAVDRVMAFLDSLERSRFPGTVSELRVRPSPGSSSQADLVVEATLMHPVLTRPMSTQRIATAADAPGGGS